MDSLNISVNGFRAPYNRLNDDSFKILSENYDYDASIIEGFSVFYSDSTLAEIKVSSFLFVPLEDVIFLYYLKVPSKIYYFLLTHLPGTNSYLFHPQHVTKKNSFKYFDKFLNDSLNKNTEFLTHQKYLRLIN